MNQLSNRLNHKGFSLIEIMVVIFIMVLVGRMSIGLLIKRAPLSLSTQFKDSLSGLIKHAYQKSLINHTHQKITIDLKKRMIYFDDDSEQWTSAFPSFFRKYGQINVPQAMSIQELYIANKEVLRKAGKEVLVAWFYMSKDGVCQPVIINARFTEKNIDYTTSFVISPFGAGIEEYATYQKPS